MRDLLRSGGGISLRTDVPAYAQQMLEVLDAVEGLVNLAGKQCFVSEPLEPHPTPYETRYRGQGKKIFYIEYRKVIATERDGPRSPRDRLR